MLLMRSDFSRYEVDIETLKNWCAYEKPLCI